MLINVMLTKIKHVKSLHISITKNPQYKCTISHFLNYVIADFLEIQVRKRNLDLLNLSIILKYGTAQIENKR